MFQVRDVLKGILKPATVFDSDEIHIKDNHYQDETPSSIDLTPGSQNSRGSPMRHPRGAFYPSSSVDTSSDPDSSSPEVQESLKQQQQAHHQQQQHYQQQASNSRRGSGSSRHGSQVPKTAQNPRHNYNYHINPQEEHVLSKSTLQKLLNKAGIELQEFKNKTVQRQMSHPDDVVGDHRYDNQSSSHRRSYSAGNHSMFPPDHDSNMFDSNRNSHGKVNNEASYKISY